MEHRLMLEKVCLVTEIINTEEDNHSYVKEVLKEQLAFGWKASLRR